MMYRIVRSAAWWSAILGGVLLALVVVITVVNVAGFLLNTLARPFGGSVSGLPGYEDAVSLLVGVGAMLLLPWCQWTRGHVSVDLFTSLLSGTTLSWLTRITDALMGAVAAFLAVMLTIGMLSFRADGVRTPVLEWLTWPFLAPAIAALALWALVALALAFDPTATERADLAAREQEKPE